MTQPVGGSSRSHAYDYDHWQHEAETSKPLEMCRKADTVLEGFLCDEPMVTVNACKRPKNDVDAFICDDKKMAGAGESAWEATKDALKTLLLLLLKGRP